MHPILRNILAAVSGLLIGSLVNGGLVTLGGHIIPPPAGLDITTEAGLKAAMPLMGPEHFLMPFLAHALGTFSGAWIAATIAIRQKMLVSLVIGAFFFIGGVIMVRALSAPVWFNITDLVLAYFPMAWLGGKLAQKK